MSKTRPTTPVSFNFEQQPVLPVRKKSVSDFRYRGDPVALDNWQPSPPLFSGQLNEEAIKDALGRIIQQLFGMGNVQYHMTVEGTYNNIYIFRIGSKRSPNLPESVLCRLSRPAKVQSLLSVRSEVETMMYLRDKRSVPIPQVYAYGTTCSLMGTTFIIMQHITNADTLANVIHTLPTSAKEEVARQYARIIFQLSQMRFVHMGSIRQGKDGVFGVGSMSLPRGDRMARMTTSNYRSIRRSFPTVQEWAEAMEKSELKLLEEHLDLVNRYVQNAPDPEEEAISAVKRANEAMTGIIQALPNVCGGDVLSRTFCLWHADLNPSNILIKTRGPEAGYIVSIIDWEGAAIMPLWMLTKFPNFFLHEPHSGRYEKIYMTELERLDPRRLLIQSSDPKWDLQRRLVEVVLKPWSDFEAREIWLDEYRRRSGQMTHVKRLKRTWTLGWGGGMAERSKTM